MAECPSGGRIIVVYNILRDRPISIVRPSFRPDSPSYIGVEVIECNSGIFDDVDGIARRVYDEFRPILIDLNRLSILIIDGKFEEARGIALKVEEALGPGFSGLFTGLVKRARRGLVRQGELRNIAWLVNVELLNRVYRELSRKYTVLDAGKYALVTNGPPGVFKLPESPVEVDNLLAGLGLGVVVREVIDIDVAFSNVLRVVNNDYARVLLDAYLRLRPVNIQLDGIKPWLVPMIVRSIENGHLTIIRGSRIYEYPSISISQDDVLDVFDNITSLDWI